MRFKITAVRRYFLRKSELPEGQLRDDDHDDTRIAALKACGFEFTTSSFGDLECAEIERDIATLDELLAWCKSCWVDYCRQRSTNHHDLQRLRGMMNTDHYNMSSKYARDQEHHDFVRNSGLPLEYFHEQEQRTLRDRWVVVAVVVLFAIAFVGVRWYGW